MTEASDSKNFPLNISTAEPYNSLDEIKNDLRETIDLINGLRNAIAEMQYLCFVKKTFDLYDHYTYVNTLMEQMKNAYDRKQYLICCLADFDSANFEMVDKNTEENNLDENIF